MRIQFERSGGFTGMIFEADIDINDLPEDEAQEIKQLVDSANFFALPSKIEDDAPASDQFQYKVTIETEGRTRTVETSGLSGSQEMQQLLQKLTILARSGGSH